ncbi:membrane hypothetical protein [Desulfarculales bacterium]
MYLITEVLKISGLLPWLAGFLTPLMGWWGLPGEAAPLGLTWQQVSVLGLILGIAHSLPVETAVVAGLTPRYKVLTLLRVLLGLTAGWALAWVLV